MASTYSDPDGTATSEAPTTSAEEIPVVAGDVELASLPFSVPPTLEEASWVGYALDEGDLAVCIRPVAIAQIMEHASSDTSVELGGVLLGYAYKGKETGDTRTYVEVRAAIPIQTADHGPIHFTFTADAWSQVHRDRAVRYPALNIVGWFHTHPGLGVFFSADDVTVHTAAFTMPWHVGLVVDPVHNEAALFGWHADGIVPFPGFYELTPADGSKLTPWRMVSTEVWLDTYEAHLATEIEPSRGGTSWTRRSLGNAWFPLALGGAVLLLAVILLANMLIMANRRASVLESISHNYLAAHLSAAQDVGLASCSNPTLIIMAPLAAETVAAGENIDVLGQASLSEASRYLVQVRPLGATDWVELNRFRRSVRAGLLAGWDTSAFAKGQYELRLLAVDRDDQPLSSSAHCTLVLEIN